MCALPASTTTFVGHLQSNCSMGRCTTHLHFSILKRVRHDVIFLGLHRIFLGLHRTRSSRSLALYFSVCSNHHHLLRLSYRCSPCGPAVACFLPFPPRPLPPFHIPLLSDPFRRRPSQTSAGRDPKEGGDALIPHMDLRTVPRSPWVSGPKCHIKV
jgi:hypothetical protein